MNTEIFDADLSSMLGQALQKKAGFKDPLLRLRYNLKFSAVFAASFGILYGAMAILVPVWPINLCFAILVLFTIWGVITTLHMRSLLSEPDSPAPLLQELQRYVTLVRKWMRLQERLGIFVYPFSIIGGGLMGAYLASGEPVANLLNDKVLDVLLVVALLVMMPICAGIARTMNRVKYGRYLDDLQKNIDELTADNA
jgi:hypothetical protein